MNQFLEHNIKQLNVPEQTAERLRAHKPDGSVSLTMSGGGKFHLTVNGQHLYDAENPVPHAAAEVQRLTGEAEQDMVIYFGLGIGIHAEFLVKRFAAPLLIWEPDIEILAVALSARPFQLENVFVVNRFGNLMMRSEKLLGLTEARVVAASTGAYRTLFPQAFERFQFAVKQSIKNVEISQNTMDNGVQWSAHETRNLKNIATLPPITGLSKWCRGIPGIFVGAGPSLSKNVETLKQARDRCLIVASNSSLKTLVAAGVVPHVVATIEAKDVRYHYDGVECLKDIVMAPVGPAYPGLFEMDCRGVAPLLQGPSPVVDWLTQVDPDVKVVSAAGSVALTAFSLLHTIGCDPIIGVGMDLAYTNGESHAAGADHAAIRYEVDEETNKLNFYIDRDDVQIDTYRLNKGHGAGSKDIEWCTAFGGEDRVMTYSAFNLYRSWLESAADTWASSRRLINATEGGARIHGFEEHTLSDVLDNVLSVAHPVDSWIDELLQQKNPIDLAALQGVLKSELCTIDDITDAAKDARKTASKIQKKLRSGDMAGANKLLDKLSATEAKIGALTQKSRSLVQITQAAATTLQRGRHADKSANEVDQMQRSLERSKKLFGKIIHGAGQLKKMLNEAVEGLG